VHASSMTDLQPSSCLLIWSLVSAFDFSNVA